ncbi:MAG: ATP-binding protein [Pseudomonadota bacterium]
MAIEGYDKRSFGEAVSKVVSPAQPIDSVEHLVGRARELEQIERALMQPGRNVFIFGERGVGKSSLAATAATQLQSSDSRYIDVACAQDSTLSSVVADIVSRAVSRSRLTSEVTTTKSGADLKFISHSIESERRERDLRTEIRLVTDAIDALREVEAIHSDQPVVVIDEVDRIADKKEIDKFGDLLKHIGDKKLGIKFLFTGVGKTLDEILGSHQSAIRQLETIELPRLSWDARWDIAIAALGHFGIEISRDICVRLAAVSDGFPYYVHLLVEKILWCLYDEEGESKSVTWDLYVEALREAITSIHAELARPYVEATAYHSPEYEHIVWATCAGDWQGSNLRTMYGTYESVAQQLQLSSVLNYNSFCNRLRNLTKTGYGSILERTRRKGSYQYREKILRGYVRMQAEANDVIIWGEEARANVKNYMKSVPSRRTGVPRSQPPSGYPRGWKV